MRTRGFLPSEGGADAQIADGASASGYASQKTYKITGVISLPEGTEMCMPGDNVEMDVELITPIAIEEGLRFAIREGGRTVGSGVVTAINA